MLPQDRLRRAIEIVEPRIGVGPVIDYLKECSAVEIVCTTLGDQIDLGGAASGIRAHRARRNAEFRSRVQRGSSKGKERTRLNEVVHRVDAVLREVDCRLAKTTDRRAPHVSSDHRNTGLQASKIDRVSIAKRKINDLPGVDDIGKAWASSIDDLLGCRDRDCFTRETNLQRYVHLASRA